MPDRQDAAAGELHGAPVTGRQRERMIRAACETIAERGFSETRISDVADRIGLSPALVVYYFRTKAELLAEAIRYTEDTWYAHGQRRLAAVPTAAGRVEEIIAMTCLPSADPEPSRWWLLWVDLWAQAARHPELAEIRQRADQRWRELITEQVLAGQAAGEFRGVDASDFAICLSSLLDGFAIRGALGDPVIGTGAAFEASMQFAASQLGFDWTRRSAGC